MNRRIICVLFAALMLLTFAACGKNNKASEPPPEPVAIPMRPPSASPSPSPEPEEELTVLPNPIWTPAPQPLRTPAPSPSATPMPLATAAPSAAPSAAAQSSPGAPQVTRQPKGEAHYAGESAVFIVAAENWSTLRWTAVSPSGREITIKRFLETFPDCSVNGENETTLTITNLNIDMSGWSFYCTFEKDGRETKTNSARLKVTNSNGGRGGSSGSGSKSKRLRCPHCGSEVPRDLLDCPFCGEEIYNENEYGYVTQDADGDIFYYDNTGALYYDNAEKKSTYVDTNTNYAIFNEGGLVKSGNINKEEKKAKEDAALAAMLAGDPFPMLDNYWEQLNSPEESK